MGKAYEQYTVKELKQQLRNKNMKVSGTKEELITRLRSKNSKQNSKQNIPANVVNPKLYIKAKNKVKKRVKVYPSAYASGQIVSEYKKMGGTYSKTGKNKSLDRWYREKWVNVCDKNKDGKFKKCGRKTASNKKYPYCRPSIRVNKKTPKTVNEIVKKHGNKKLTELCRKKRKTGLPKKGKPSYIRSKATRNNN